MRIPSNATVRSLLDCSYIKVKEGRGSKNSAGQKTNGICATTFGTNAKTPFYLQIRKEI